MAADSAPILYSEANVGTQPRDKDTRARVLVWVALVFSVVPLGAYFLVNLWVDAMDAESGSVALIDAQVAELLAYLVLVVVALILDVVAIGLTLTVVAKENRRRTLIVGVIALVVLVGPIAGTIIQSAIVTNG